MPSAALPAALTRGPFSVADALRLGVPPSRLRRVDLVAPTRGVRAKDAPASLVERARAMAVGMPADGALSHVTAAMLMGVPLPARVEDPGAPLDVIRASARTRVRRRGCVGHRGLEAREVQLVHGLRVTSSADTWVDLGEVLDRGIGLDDLVVAGDFVATTLGALEPLRAALARRVRPRGGRALAASLLEVRPGARSPMETRARLMFTRAGAPAPEVNAAVTDRHGGWLLEGDLVWRRQRVIVEYQGAVHAPIEHRSRDAQRRELAADEGWRVIEVFKEDVFHPGRRHTCIGRLLRAVADGP